MLLLIACDHSAQEGNNSTDADSQVGYPPFVAPEDNRLTEQYVKLYIAVKNTEKELLDNLLDDLQKGRQGNTTSIGAIHFQDIEESAIQMNQLSSNEYEWIKNTVINSRIQQQFQEYFALNQQIIALLEGTLQRYETTRKNLKDPEEIAILDSHVREINEHIQTLKNQIEKYTHLTGSEKHNIEIVKKFSAQLEAIEKYQTSIQKKNQ